MTKEEYDKLTDEALPYDFDLLYDIKTKTQLAAEYLRLKAELWEIEDTCYEHGVDIVSIIAASGGKQ